MKPLDDVGRPIQVEHGCLAAVLLVKSSFTHFQQPCVRGMLEPTPGLRGVKSKTSRAMEVE